MRLRLIVFVLFPLIFVCDLPSQMPPSPAPQPQHPAWTLSPVAKRKLVEQVSKLKAGDSYDAVITLLGKPDSDLQEIPKGVGTVSHGRLLQYRMSTWETGLSNTFHDENIYVDLDTKDRVRETSIHVALTE